MQLKRASLYVSIIFISLPIIVLPQSPTRQDTTNQKTSGSSSKQKISLKIKKLIKSHYNNEDKVDEKQILESKQTEKEELAQPDTNTVQKADYDTTLDITNSLEVNTQYLNIDSLEKKTSIVINNGEAFTKSQQVNLKIHAPGAIGLKVNNVENFSSLSWRPIANIIDWELTEGDGYKRVYIKMLYPDSTVSSIFYDEIVLDNTPPIAKFTTMPDSGIAGETLFSFNATGSYHNFELYLRWDWENDGNFDTPWETTKEKAHKFLKGGGKKAVKLQVKSSGGWIVDYLREIVVFSRPEPLIEYSQNFENPSLFTFDASQSTDFEDGENLVIRWDFEGDSLWDTQWSSSKREIRELGDLDVYDVILEVKDSHGLTKSLRQPIQNKYRNMVYIPSGNFMMGSNDSYLDESPDHLVFLKDFWIDKYPVTNQQYVHFLNLQKDIDVQRYLNFDNNDIKIQIQDSVYFVENGFEDHPLILVTWYGAKAYADYFGKNLPTEAEWEKSACGTEKRKFPWGNEISGEFANYWDSGDPYDNNTTPVGFYNGSEYNGIKTADSKSPYGVYDLVGNVREWCDDWYKRDYYAESPLDNPGGPVMGEKKVVRGGGYLFYENTLRTTFRSSYEPTTANNYIGFRCVIRK